MKDYITIGQAAKLLDISTHQIRHYEECGIVKPIINKENGYRLYGQEEFYRLAHVLFLRRFDIPIADIKTAFSSYEKSDYLNLFQDKIYELEDRINELKELKKQTENLSSGIVEFEKNENVFNIIEVDERKLQVLKTISYTQDISFLDFFNFAKNIYKIHEKEFYLIFKNDKVLLCIEGDDGSNKVITLKNGRYLKYSFIADSEKCIDSKYKEFAKYVKKQKIKTDKSIILRDKSLLSIAYNNHLCYEFECEVL